MLHIGICDDNQKDISRVQELAGRFSEQHPEMPVQIQAYSSPYDLLDDIKKQDFSNTKKFASTCDLSKIVEFINKLPFKEKEENDSDNITHINEETLLKLYHEVPSRGKRDALQVIKDTLDKSENNNKTKEEVGGEL